MQIALLSGANPKSCKVGPVVRLIPGSWNINIQGMNDSELALYVDGFMHLVGKTLELSLIKVAHVQFKFMKRGTEPYITAFAERI